MVVLEMSPSDSVSSHRSIGMDLGNCASYGSRHDSHVGLWSLVVRDCNSLCLSSQPITSPTAHFGMMDDFPLHSSRLTHSSAIKTIENIKPIWMYIHKHMSVQFGDD